MRMQKSHPTLQHISKLVIHFCIGLITVEIKSQYHLFLREKQEIPFRKIVNNRPKNPY